MKTNINSNLINDKINNIISKHGAVILVNKNKILENSDIILKKINNSLVAPVIK